MAAGSKHITTSSTNHASDMSSHGLIAISEYGQPSVQFVRAPLISPLAGQAGIPNKGPLPHTHTPWFHSDIID